MWCIPSKENAAFACAMEQVLAVYQRPFDPKHPVVCMDETSKQCVEEVRQPLPGKPGQTACYDSEYERNGVAHLISLGLIPRSLLRYALKANGPKEKIA